MDGTLTIRSGRLLKVDHVLMFGEKLSTWVNLILFFESLLLFLRCLHFWYIHEKFNHGVYFGLQVFIALES
jgi:hypothetical protein